MTAHRSACAVLAMLAWALVGCPDANPASDCTSGEHACDGAVARYCVAADGGKALPATRNRWATHDCGEEGLVCVLDGGAVACVETALPCEATPTRCEDNAIVSCAQVQGHNGIKTAATFTTRLACSAESACVIGTVHADCGQKGALPCAAPGTGTCDGAMAVWCNAAGVTFREACAAGGLTCAAGLCQ